MATLLSSHTSLPSYHHPCRLQSPSPLRRFSSKPIPVLRYSTLSFSCYRILTLHSPAASKLGQSEGLAQEPPQTPSQTFLRLVVSSAVFIGVGILFGARACSAASFQFPPFVADDSSTMQEELTGQGNQDEEKCDSGEKLEDKKLEAAFKIWKSKTYALTVPLKVIALRGSVPPAWIKDFMQSQGRRLKFQLKQYGSLEGIFSDLSMPFNKGNVGSSSVVAADVVSIGDSWLSYAIKKSIIEPIEGVEDQEWFKGLSAKWKVYLRRNNEGAIDPAGKVWAAPYRWGCMVIAYKKSKFQQYRLAPIEDWADLWRPELAGRISMVDSPREVVGAVLKYVGASYNTNSILQVDGVQQNLALLRNQVRLFDSMNYLKAFGAGDAWVAVGWSSDVLPVAKRMSNIAVVVPKSGASLWADLWAIPAASRLKTNKIGGRIRGPSPLIHQWIEFCLQAARTVPFVQEVIPGASPSALETTTVEPPIELSKGKPRLDTNLVAGLPPPDILAGCEFLEPLSDSTLSEYQWLISSIQKSNHDRGLVHKVKAG
ncbi:hypothetical protein FNV43_RR09976 [Rhamnella rubrinervis]|uniref:Uncharacterized protein n=1 Tax=Rhamnella rubrinervis TaxID=2594499 RepID=A0A8K0HCC3_9ROSA|nr:hypothetical protein FNV43_RR09976 [Rhamnella rubrinervis]